MSELRIILSTVALQSEAARVGHELVEGRFAACVNIVPALQSIYRWQERVHDEAEVMMIIKTTRAGLDATIGRLRELHPYDVPEIVVLDPESVDAAYDAWVIESCD